MCYQLSDVPHGGSNQADIGYGLPPVDSDPADLMNSLRHRSSLGPAASCKELIKAACPILALVGSHFVPILRPVMRVIVILFVLIAQVLSKTINAYTTSGRLLGTEADGGMCYLLLLAFPSPK